jgi:adenylate cyclase, class 2
MHLNIEIKARCADPGRIRTLLQELAADFKGEDHQIDTYFNVPEGRLKLREGNIENALIHYRRADQVGPKRSEVTLYRTSPGAVLKEVLTAALGVRKVVDKKREIYFIGNVKFHIDSVKGLGSFVEIEAIDADGSLGEAKLREQCDYYLGLFDIREENLVEESYSDMVF